MKQAVLAGIVLLAVAIVHLRSRRRRSAPLPPGPPRLPILGNLHNHPLTRAYETYIKWSKEYDSDVLYFDLGGSSMIVLNSYEAMIDLLERRSSIYSSRPRMPMIMELMGWDYDFAFMPYGPQWRAHRRMMHQNFHEQASKQYRQTQLDAVHDLLPNLLNEPDRFGEHFRFMNSRVVMSTIYGLEVDSPAHPYIKMVDAALTALGVAGTPGRFLVDLLPALKYVPSWMPGAGFKRLAAEWYKDTRGHIEAPMAEAKRKIDSGNFTPSFVSDCLGDTASDSEHYELVQNVAGVIFAAAQETSVTTLITFTFAMALHPDIQRKAQKEIDEKLDRTQLPTFDELETLPYLTAIFMEILRWNPPVPTSVPHYIEQEDVYKGYRIPAGSTVVMNAWGILRDENYYPDPHTFNPDRFIKDGKVDSSVLDPRLVVFGSGRRVCPGRHFAEATIWMTMASMLKVFDIGSAAKLDGSLIDPMEEGLFTPGMFSAPKPFKCNITPRSELDARLVNAMKNRDV